SSFRTITHATDFYTLSLHDALRSQPGRRLPLRRARRLRLCPREARVRARAAPPRLRPRPPDGRAPAPRDAPLARRPHRLLHPTRAEDHPSELQSLTHLLSRLLPAH